MKYRRRRRGSSLRKSVKHKSAIERNGGGALKATMFPCCLEVQEEMSLCEDCGQEMDRAALDDSVIADKCNKW